MALPLPISPRHHFHYILSSSTPARHIRSFSGGEGGGECSALRWECAMSWSSHVLFIEISLFLTSHHWIPCMNVTFLSRISPCRQIQSTPLSIPSAVPLTSLRAPHEEKCEEKRKVKEKQAICYRLHIWYIMLVSRSPSLSLSLVRNVSCALCTFNERTSIVRQIDCMLAHLSGHRFGTKRKNANGWKIYLRLLSTSRRVHRLWRRPAYMHNMLHECISMVAPIFLYVPIKWKFNSK